MAKDQIDGRSADSAREEAYQDLEREMVTYDQLKDIKTLESNERMVTLTRVEHKYTEPLVDMEAVLGNETYVREGLERRLVLADTLIRESSQGRFHLLITYGYRSPHIQEAYFRRYLAEMENDYPSQEQLYEAVHKKIAVPEVAGHPTGGAVDAILVNPEGTPVDMGTKVYDFDTKDIYTFSPFISSEAKANRQILRDGMMQTGLAPFDGEWWHFSYGDREWAFFYGQDTAIYLPVPESEVLSTTK